jgi:hypothetical protein
MSLSDGCYSMYMECLWTLRNNLQLSVPWQKGYKSNHEIDGIINFIEQSHASIL